LERKGPERHKKPPTTSYQAVGKDEVGGSNPPSSSKKERHDKSHVVLFWFRRPVAAFTLRYLKCSGEVNSPCAKVFAKGENACTAHKRRPVVWGTGAAGI